MTDQSLQNLILQKVEQSRIHLQKIKKLIKKNELTKDTRDQVYKLKQELGEISDMIKTASIADLLKQDKFEEAAKEIGKYY